MPIPSSIRNPYQSITNANNAGMYGNLDFSPANSINAVGSLASGAMSIYGDARNTIDQERGINTSISQDQFSGIKPQYQMSDELSSLGGLRDTAGDVGKGLAGRSMLTGFTSGLAAGTAVNPGIGSLIGGIGGALIGGITGNAAKNKAIDERYNKIDELSSGIDLARDQFNDDNRSYSKFKTGRETYDKLMERKNKNLYNIPSFYNTLT